MQNIIVVPIWILLCLFGLSQTTEIALTATLPDIAKSFDIKGSQAQVCSSVYFLGFASGILILGRISDIYGRRPLILGGMGLYCIASILSIFAPTIQILIALRFIQAFGASVGSVVGQAVARDSFHGKDLSKTYASLAIALALVPSIGATLGGYIVQYSSWHFVFLTLSIISAILFVLYFKCLPETNTHIGVALNNSYLKIAKIVITDRILLSYALIIGAFTSITFGFYMEAPFIFIDRLQFSPAIYAKLMFLLTIATAGGSFLCRFLVKKDIRTKKIMITGLVCSFVGCSILLISNVIELVPKNKILVIFVIFIPMMFHLIGHSLLIPFCMRYALQDYRKVSGTAGSIFGFLYYTVIILSSFLISKLHNAYGVAKFTFLFFMLSLISIICFIYIRKLIKNKEIPMFY